MSTTGLNDLQLQVAAALASGMAPADVRDKFALTSSSFETWRQNEAFVAEVQRIKTADADDEQLKRVDEITDEMSRYPRGNS